MKRRYMYSICLSTLLLCSCNSNNNFANKYMFEHSGITKESSYQQYEELADQLNENGEYDNIPDEYDAIPASAAVREKPICLTFNQNSKLNIRYYSDEKCEQEIRPKINIQGNNYNFLEHYLSPGESVYAKIENSEELYEFDKFRIIDDIETRSEISEKWWSADNSVYTITVPESFTGTDIIIEPLGVYHCRTLTLSDYIDVNGLQRNTGGIWAVTDDDKKYESGKVYLSPYDIYTVKYKYDENLYYTSEESCIPAPYHIDESKGTVEFVTDNGNNTSYLVKLHPYTNVSIVNDKKISSILRNDESVTSSEKITSISKLKEGEVITIEVNDPKYKINGISDYSKTSSGYKFTYVIPKAASIDNNDYSFNVEKWGNKKISVTAKDQNSDSFNIFGTIADWFKSENADDSAIVIEVSGTENQTYLYKDTRAGKTITINETDIVSVKVNQSILSAGNIKIIINGTDTYEVNSQSVKTYFKFKYSDIDSLNIEINETI